VVKRPECGPGPNILARRASPLGHGVECSSGNLGAGMQDALEIELLDAEGMEEIRLIANLMIATATARDRLSQRSIDSVLGLASSTP
jgi:hypothetical protein